MVKMAVNSLDDDDDDDGDRCIIHIIIGMIIINVDLL